MTTPHSITANGFYNVFTGRKKWTITCGKCLHTWTEKVPLNEPASAICTNPNCRAQNTWSIASFARLYDKSLLD